MKYSVKNQFSSQYHRQQGVVIVVALVTLLVMTMVGLTSIGNATLQERMAANNRFYLQARLNAETALRFAEDYLSGRVDAAAIAELPNATLDTASEIRAMFNSGDALYMSVPVASGQPTAELDSPSDDNNLALRSVWEAAPADSTFAVNVPEVDQDSELIIEFIGTGTANTEVDLSKYEAVPSDFGTKPFVFRITAIGFSQSDGIYSVVESIYSTAL